MMQVQASGLMRAAPRTGLLPREARETLRRI